MAALRFPFLLLFLSCMAVAGVNVVLGARPTLLTAAPVTPGGVCQSIVQAHGYPCEEHTVVTGDGYILRMQRIPDGKAKSGGPKQPVLLQHGVLVDGLIWLINSPDQSLPYILADRGFDVWIANTRGTKQSPNHVSINPNNDAYWNWSWDELVTFELPALVNHVYNRTGQKIHYVGHSLGSLIAMASFSELQLLDKVKAAGLLGPVAYMNQIKSSLATTVAKTYLADNLYALGTDKFDPRGNAISALLSIACDALRLNCYDLLSSFTGDNCCLNPSTNDVFMANEPQPTSSKTMVHLMQMIRDGTVTKFDYGSASKNMKRYGSKNPPVYPLEKIPSDFPLFFAYGGKDNLADVADVKHLFQSLAGHQGDKMVQQYIPSYAHADLVMGTNARTLVYEPLISFFKSQK